MTHKHLTPSRAGSETRSAMTFAVIGVWIWVTTEAAQIPPLAFMQVSHQAQINVGYTLVIAGLIHGLGIEINGRWRWSPALRVIGMFTHSIVLVWLIANTLNFASISTPIYTVAALGLILGTANALNDLMTAFRGKHGSHIA